MKSENIMNSYSKEIINKSAPNKKEKKQNQRKNSQNTTSNINNSKSNLDLKYNINNSKNTNSFITLNNTNINEKKNILEFNDYELNSMNFNEALKYDKRNYLNYYWSLLRTKHILLFAIIPSNDYNSTINKICLFIFSFAL